MDYEDLYLQLQSLEKDIKDKLAAAQRGFKNLCNDSEKGDIKNLSKDLTQMSNFINDYRKLTEEYKHLTEEFDAKEYMENGDFAHQMIQYCENLSVDIKGEYPSYDMFPYKVKIDSENIELNVNRKKIQSVRPQYFVKSIKQNQEKLNKVSFNANNFLNEIAEAYDIASIYKGKASQENKNENDMFLKDLYDYMVPMNRFRRDYDIQSYAFDIARLLVSGVELTKDGRSFELGPSRYNNKLIRILDRDGNEQYIGTIRFFTR